MNSSVRPMWNGAWESHLVSSEPAKRDNMEVKCEEVMVNYLENIGFFGIFFHFSNRTGLLVVRGFKLMEIYNNLDFSR